MFFSSGRSVVEIRRIPNVDVACLLLNYINKNEMLFVGISARFDNGLTDL